VGFRDEAYARDMIDITADLSYGAIDPLFDPPRDARSRRTRAYLFNLAVRAISGRACIFTADPVTA
jgi:hypothetical protein